MRSERGAHSQAGGQETQVLVLDLLATLCITLVSFVSCGSASRLRSCLSILPKSIQNTDGSDSLSLKRLLIAVPLTLDPALNRSKYLSGTSAVAPFPKAQEKRAESVKDFARAQQCGGVPGALLQLCPN